MEVQEYNENSVVKPQVGAIQSFDPEEPIRDAAKVICPCTESIRTIPTEDSVIIQDGQVFKAETKFTIANNATVFLAFETPPATEQIPLYVIWGRDLLLSDTNNVTYRLWEEAIYTVGDLQPIINQNRVLKDLVTPLSVLTPNPTAVDIGSATEIDLSATLGAQDPGLFGGPTGGSTAGQRFLVLMPSTKYVIEIFNDEGGQTANAVFKSTFIEALFPGLYAKANPS